MLFLDWCCIFTTNKLIDIFDFLRNNKVTKVYILSVNELSRYKKKVMALLTVLEEMEIEVVSFADWGEITPDTYCEIVTMMAGQLQVDRDVQNGIDYENPL